MNLLELLFGAGQNDPASQTMAPANNVPRVVPVPVPRPGPPQTGAKLPGGSFTPNKQPVTPPQDAAQASPAAPGAQVPGQTAPALQDILTGGQRAPTTFRDRFRAFAAGAGNLGNSGGDPFVSFGQGAGGAAGYYADKEKQDIAKAVEMRKLKVQEQLNQKNLKTGGVSYGKTPVWGTDPVTGNPVIGVIGDDGTFKRVDTSGVDLSTGIEKIDAGTHWQLRDKRSGETVGMVPKENYQESFDKTKGSEDAKIKAEVPKLRSKAMSSMEALETKQTIVTDTIDDAISSIEASPNMMTGLVGGLASAIPGTDAYNLARKLDTIKANVGFDQLQAMRDASPTGGALGQVSEMENRLLQSVLGSLDQAQSADEVLANLQRLKVTIENARETRRGAFERDFGGSVPAEGGGLSEPSSDSVIDYTDYFGAE